MEKKIVKPDEEVPLRLQLGEAFMFCSECMGKLYSFDGTEDACRNCPTPQKCKEDRQRIK